MAVKGKTGRRSKFIEATTSIYPHYPRGHSPWAVEMGRKEMERPHQEPQGRFSVK
jgi:hypothetical protein